MSQAAYIQDMLDDPGSDPDVPQSEIASFYDQQNVLLTGATGFLGRLLSERILRSCSKVNTLFLLVRAKKGKSPEERFKELFDDQVFDRLKTEQPEFARKVMLIESDMGQVGLGLSPQHRELLLTTHIVIHGAATVRFDEKLRLAAHINVRGTQELISLAEEMKNLKAFVHISTAYSHCVGNEIDEKFYPPPIDPDDLLSLLRVLDDASLDHLSPVLLGKWPNTYAFTKAVAEDVIRRSCHILPLCIVRPSIIVATSEEPVAGWINNVYGLTGVIAAGTIGLMHSLLCDENLVADVIPADYVISDIIVAAWDIAKAHGRIGKINNVDRSRITMIENPPIYNIVSSAQNPVEWGKLVDDTIKFGRAVPSTLSIWYPFFKLNKNRWTHNLSVVLFHSIPAAIVDCSAALIGKQPMLRDKYNKVHKFSAAIEYFSMQQWQFHDNNVQRLFESLSSVDRTSFNFDIKKLDWEEYSYHNFRGIRVYILKDPLDTVPQGLARDARLKVAHYTLITVLCGFILFMLSLTLRFIGLW